MNFEINIKDSGVGISKEGIRSIMRLLLKGISKLFMNFGKLTENSGMNKSGTGLGLSICKQIIE